MKNIYKYLLAFIALMIFFYIAAHTKGKQWCDNANNEFIDLEFRGNVVSIFIDSSNHLAPSIRLDDSTILQFTMDTSSFYKEVKLKDSLSKSKGSNIINVKSGSALNEYAIFYDCY